MSPFLTKTKIERTVDKQEEKNLFKGHLKNARQDYNTFRMEGAVKTLELYLLL